MHNPGDNLYNTPPQWLDGGIKVVKTRRSSLIIDPTDGRVPTMTAEGVKRREELAKARATVAGPESLDPWERCITPGTPRSHVPGIQNNNVRILQTPGYLVVVTEMIHERACSD